jgi:formate hydrogenlyase subunit 3/multisubunit Na+/H+ antiporter MnhD subunit
LDDLILQLGAVIAFGAVFALPTSLALIVRRLAPWLPNWFIALFSVVAICAGLFCIAYMANAAGHEGRIMLLTFASVLSAACIAIGTPLCSCALRKWRLKKAGDLP